MTCAVLFTSWGFVVYLAHRSITAMHADSCKPNTCLIYSLSLHKCVQPQCISGKHCKGCWPCKWLILPLLSLILYYDTLGSSYLARATTLILLGKGILVRHANLWLWVAAAIPVSREGSLLDWPLPWNLEPESCHNVITKLQVVKGVSCEGVDYLEVIAHMKWYLVPTQSSLTANSL